MIYLASPYTHPDAAVRQERFEQVSAAAGELMKQGHRIFSPIVHCHPIAEATEMPTDWEFWREYDWHMIDAADSVWVLMLDGWEESTGVQAEIQYARETEKNIAYFVLDTRGEKWIPRLISGPVDLFTGAST